MPNLIPSRIRLQLLSSRYSSIGHPSLRSVRFFAHSSSSILMAQQYKIKGLSALDLKPGEKREVEVEGIDNGKILLARVGNKTHALSSNCTHYGGKSSVLVLYFFLLVWFCNFFLLVQIEQSTLDTSVFSYLILLFIIFENDGKNRP